MSNVVKAEIAMLVVMVATLCIHSAEAEPYFDVVTFQVVNEPDEALELLRNGVIHIYYYDVQSVLPVPDDYPVTTYVAPAGGFFGLLLNPAEGERFNPLQIPEVRFATNFLIDRQYVVDELMDGYGAPMMTYVSPFEPDYLNVIETVEYFGLKYDPKMANLLIHDAMTEAGAVLRDNTWHVQDEPVIIKILIRSDDPIRHGIGDDISDELEAAGIVVERIYVDLGTALDTVDGHDPAELSWHIYTEGWGGQSYLPTDVGFWILTLEIWTKIRLGYELAR